MAHRPDPDASIHAGYAAEGVRGFYQRHGGEYRNPHEPEVHDLIASAVAEWPLDLTHVLDLAAGSGEATAALVRRVGDAPLRIDAIDPYTAAAYEARTGRPCEALSFEDVAAGGLAGRAYSLVVCSFALHLAEPSRLPVLCWRLAEVAGQLLILTPHKRPAIEERWGWRLTHERLRRRVRARLYAVQPAAKGLS